MSLDVMLTMKRDEPTDGDKAIELLRANGLESIASTVEAHHEHGDIRVYDSNITHNLGRMAEEAGIYKCLWRPEEIGITKASQLIPLLTEGLAKLHADRPRFEKFNASNGWGLYENFVPWVSQYLEACRENPDADVSVWR